MILKLTVDLPEEQPYVRVMRLLGRTLLTDLRAVEQDIDEIELVVGELCANVIRHARSSEQRFQVSLEYDADRVIITVHDSGIGFNPLMVPAIGAERPDFSGLPERIGGYGLKLVELLSDSMEFEKSDQSGTVVRVEKVLHYHTKEDSRVAHEMCSSYP